MLADRVPGLSGFVTIDRLFDLPVVQGQRRCLPLDADSIKMVLNRGSMYTVSTGKATDSGTGPVFLNNSCRLRWSQAANSLRLRSSISNRTA